MDGHLDGDVPPGGGLSAPEALLLRLTNAARRAAGLRAAAPDPALMRAARARCAHMAASGQVAHRCDRWSGPLELQRAHGVCLRVMGAENLALHRDIQTAFAAWMASAAHRANILYPDHDRTGLAVLPAHPRGVAACQEFGGV